MPETLESVVLGTAAVSEHDSFLETVDGGATGHKHDGKWKGALKG